MPPKSLAPNTSHRRTSSVNPVPGPGDLHEEQHASLASRTRQGDVFCLHSAKGGALVRGSKHHFIVDGQCIPLAVTLPGGNRNDVTQLLPLLDKTVPVAGRVGRPRRRPKALLADRAYDHDVYRRQLWQRGIRPVIARRGEPHGTGLGIFRYVVERTIAWLHGFRRVRIRWERRDDIHETFLGLAVCAITYRHVQRLC
ncbi:IS5 family transposase [Streptomyces atriruber]|uniref:IS5 family transposase n=1 Tax=Streptomyces atriruber TaxID=545121 RepID=A0ABV3BYC9_9ACTN